MGSLVPKRYGIVYRGVHFPKIDCTSWIWCPVFYGIMNAARVFLSAHPSSVTVTVMSE